MFLYNIGKRYNFINPDYLLLTPENNWYPKPGADGGNIHSGSGRMDFIKFSLNVKTDEKRTFYFNIDIPMKMLKKERK